MLRLRVCDREKMREKAQRRQSTGTQEKEPRKEEEEERLTKRVMGLICKAHVSTGDRQRQDPVVMTTLRSKYRPRVGSCRPQCSVDAMDLVI